ncbi:FecR family protein [Marinagarivorans cellulosilyticus]|uniref:FecR protein domain-containing protein n=1 Tax=Marinagarivorans cellulosilyticus TaxID=2721545 RepID=A0AAN1WGH6_9GAMM|nr:FecR family protein [Marinagarivorans cellulosilyticus]BCD97154.1 hypothetical protein MARGE09_P1355 [Marinagarivorans cellulosilyticus]
MKNHILITSVFILLSSTLNADAIKTVNSGDTLIKLLKQEGFEGEYADLHPLLNKIKTLNSDRFSNKSLDLIFPGERIIIPTPYIAPEPEPEPEPEPVVIPEPTAIAEPALNYVGTARLGKSQAELIRDNASEVISDEINLITLDTLRTDKNGSAEIELNDNSHYIVGPSSEFIIEDFQYQPSITENFVAKLNLLIGVISVKTGKIGKDSEDTYQLNTPAVTMGVRGTEYTVRYCEGEHCGDLLGATAAVKEGAIVVNTSAGEIEVPKGKFVQVESIGAEASIGDIPEGFFDLNLSPDQVQLSWFERVKKYARDLIQ